jgi:hypothetical protein
VSMASASTRGWFDSAVLASYLTKRRSASAT